MLKGVNRQVVEIKETDNAYFERVLFFVKPEFSSLSEGKLKRGAEEIIKASSPPPNIKKTEKKKITSFRIAELLSAAFMGAAFAGSAVFFFIR